MEGVLLERTDAPKTRRPELLGFLSAVGPLASFIAIAITATWYFILTVSYNIFYNTLDVKPDEVGLDYLSILRSSIGLLAITVSVAGLIYAISY